MVAGLFANSRLISELCGEKLLTAKDAKGPRRSQRNSSVLMSGFVVLVWFVDGDTTKVLGQFQKPLIVVVPVGGRFVDHHDALLGETELHEAGLANVGLQPAR